MFEEFEFDSLMIRPQLTSEFIYYLFLFCFLQKEN